MLILFDINKLFLGFQNRGIKLIRLLADMTTNYFRNSLFTEMRK